MFQAGVPGRLLASDSKARSSSSFIMVRFFKFHNLVIHLNQLFIFIVIYKYEDPCFDLFKVPTEPELHRIRGRGFGSPNQIRNTNMLHIKEST